MVSDPDMSAGRETHKARAMDSACRVPRARIRLEEIVLQTDAQGACLDALALTARGALEQFRRRGKQGACYKPRKESDQQPVHEIVFETPEREPHRLAWRFGRLPRLFRMPGERHEQHQRRTALPMTDRKLHGGWGACGNANHARAINAERLQQTRVRIGLCFR